MASSTGSAGMTKIEYLGKQMSSIWDGPATQQRYRFGADRKVGWVDNRDVAGFLSLKDKNSNPLFKKVEGGNDAVAVEATPVLAVAGEGAVSATVVEGKEEVLTVVADPAEETVSATVVVQGADFPDPNNLYPSDIKRLTLTKEQWSLLYQAELAGKKRPTVITYVEEKLASE